MLRETYSEILCEEDMKMRKTITEAEDISWLLKLVYSTRMTRPQPKSGSIMLWPDFKVDHKVETSGAQLQSLGVSL